MKKLECEMCGSTEFEKMGDVLVCKYCGSKFILKADGIVDDFEETLSLENLYQSARTAKDNQNMEEASKYYEKIILRDSKSWEAEFYRNYCSAMVKSGNKVDYQSLNTVLNSLNLVYKMILENTEKHSQQQKNAYTNVVVQVMVMLRKYCTETSSRSVKIEGINATYKLGDNFYELFSFDNDACQLAVRVWKQAISFHKNLLEGLNKQAQDDHKRKINTYISKINRISQEEQIEKLYIEMPEAYKKVQLKKSEPKTSFKTKFARGFFIFFVLSMMGSCINAQDAVKMEKIVVKDMTVYVGEKEDIQYTYEPEDAEVKTLQIIDYEYKLIKTSNQTVTGRKEGVTQAKCKVMDGKGKYIESNTFTITVIEK